jgi:hypothetical protein
MPIDERDFFRKVTLAICGSLDIEVALSRCLGLFREALRADELGLHLYQPDLGAIRNIGYAGGGG